jgi:hypothetical protein
MQKSKYIFYFFLLLVVGGCLSTENTSKSVSGWHPEYRLQAGINRGGIVENTDMSQVAGAEVDAYTGTKTGLGLYLDAYRGGQIYEDFYNLSSFEMPGSSFYKLGVIYQLRTW